VYIKIRFKVRDHTGNEKGKQIKAKSASSLFRGIRISAVYMKKTIIFNVVKYDARRNKSLTLILYVLFRNFYGEKEHLRFADLKFLRHKRSQK